VPVRAWLLGLMFAALTLAALIPPAMAVERPGHGFGPSIVVQGVGVVTARPDMAVLNAGVTSQSATAKAALAAHKEIMAKVLAGLAAFGIADGDVQSRHVNLRPVYPRKNQNDGVRAPVAFRASGQVRVRLRQIGRLGEMLDRLTAAGVNNLSGLHFAVAKPEPLQDRARVLAIGEAKRRAQLYAAEAGVELGPVLRIREGGGHGPRPEFRAMSPSSAGRAVAVGETEFRITVSVVYAIK
jgi:uncharacterized protein YggE